MSKIDQVTSLHKNNELQLLCFRLEKDRDLYAVNVFKIREVIKYNGALTIVSHEPNTLVEGLITIRDLTIPLIDMKKWFYYDPRQKDRALRSHSINRNKGEDDIIMICEFSRWTIGVRIYEADRILNKRWTEIEQSVGVGGNGQNGKLVSRTRYFDGRLVQVVDIEKMLTDVFLLAELIAYAPIALPPPRDDTLHPRFFAAHCAHPLLCARARQTHRQSQTFRICAARERCQNPPCAQRLCVLAVL